jgi:nitrile hydratase beta subunit
VFHHVWERRAWGVTTAFFSMGMSNGGEFRHAIERMDPGHYLTSSYYEHWVTAVATRLMETGRTETGELERLAGGKFPLSRPVRTAPPLGPDGDATRARFGLGSPVRVREWHPIGHTRCPRYVQGKRGTVVRLDGSWSLPDVEAHSNHRRSEPTYSVRFEASDLWGDSQPGVKVHVDLWESYLEEE